MTGHNSVDRKGNRWSMIWQKDHVVIVVVFGVECWNEKIWITASTRVSRRVLTCDNWPVEMLLIHGMKRRDHWPLFFYKSTTIKTSPPVFLYFFPSPALNGHRPKTKPKTVFFTIIDSKGQRNSRRKGFFLFKSSSLSISKRFICFLSLSLFLLWQHFVSETLYTWPGTLSVQSDWAVEFRFVYFDRMFNIHNLLVSKNIQQVKVWKVLFGVDLSAWRRPTRKRKETPLPSWMVNKRGQLLFPSAAIH